MYESSPSRSRRALIALIFLSLMGLTPLLSSGGAPAGAAEPARGYWMVASDGGIFAYGGAKFLGSTGDMKLNMPIVGMAATRSGNGYWLVASDGGIFAFGDAGFFGSTGAMKLNRPIVGMAATPSGGGYWLVASDGGVFAFGDAGFFGSTGDIKLNKPITGMTPSGTGKGYRMVASDGGIFSFGDAAFFGSAGGTALAKPIAGMAPTPSGGGYWLVGSDGKIFNYGDAGALGSASALKSVATIASTPSGAGYWAVAANGELAAFGDAVDLGHPTGALSKPIVGMAVVPATAISGGGTVTNPPGDPGTPTTVVPTAILDKLYSSKHLAGTIGTRPQVQEDPSHPFREMCKPWPGCKPVTRSNAQYAEEVRSLLQVGNRLFVGGFIHGLLDPAVKDDKPDGKGTDIHDDIEYLVELDALTGKVASDLTFTRNAKPNMHVQGMDVSPDGQILYISGRFTEAGGGRAPGFGALYLNGPNAGKLVDGWDPSSSTGGSVHGVALSEAGDRLFIGGAFKEVDGDTKYRMVAAVDPMTGKLQKDWVAPPFTGSYVDRAGTPSHDDEGMVNSIAVIGRYLVVGGEFLHAGPEAPTWPLSKYDPHGGLTVLNVSDGNQADWRPRNDRPVFQMTLSPDKSFLCAALGGQGGGVTCLRPGEEWPMMNTAKIPEWDGMSEHAKLDRRIAHVDGDALGVAITDKRIYLGGHFDVVQPDPDDDCLHHVPSQCFPPFSGPSRTTASDDTALPHKHLVAFTYNGDVDTTWTPWANTPEGPTVLLAGPDALYLGGNFTMLMDKHPGAACWPCEENKWAGRNPIFQPGFAMFPAVP